MHTLPSVFGVNTDLKHDTIHASTNITHCIQTDERNDTEYGMLNVALFDLFTLLFYLFYLYLQKVYY